MAGRRDGGDVVDVGHHLAAEHGAVVVGIGGQNDGGLYRPGLADLLCFHILILSLQLGCHRGKAVPWTAGPGADQ